MLAVYVLVLDRGVVLREYAPVLYLLPGGLSGS